MQQAEGTNSSVVRIDYSSARDVIVGLHTFLSKNVSNTVEQKRIEKLMQSDATVYKWAIELILSKDYCKCIDTKKALKACFTIERECVAAEDPDLEFIRVHRVPHGYRYWCLDIDKCAYKALEMMSFQASGRRNHVRQDEPQVLPRPLPYSIVKSMEGQTKSDAVESIKSDAEQHEEVQVQLPPKNPNQPVENPHDSNCVIS